MEIRSISSAAALKVAAIVLGLLIALRFLWVAHAIFIITFLGVLLGLAIARAVDYLERFRIPRGVGAPLVLLAGVGVCIAIGAMIGPSIRDQTKELTSELPKAMQQVEKWINRTPAKALVAQHLPKEQPKQQGQQKQGQQKPEGGQQQQPQQQQQGGLTAQIGRELRNATRFLFPIISSAFGAIGGLLIVMFLAMYIAATPGLYRDGLLHLVPHRHRDRAKEVLVALRDTLRQWLIARAMAMVIIGLITGGGLALIGVKGAAALGVLAGVLEFVPFFGPIVSAIPAIGIALVDSPQKALWVMGLYVLVQQLEGNVVTPLLLKRRLDVPPVLTIVAVAALGVVFGVIGMLIAEPLLAAILVTTKLLYVQDVVGDEVRIGKEKE
ncbi:MAG TPA: AI-2E family transporter [Thermoanaerobaculia bacterium]|jgi:predicted PurR-regulated permease PerM